MIYWRKKSWEHLRRIWWEISIWVFFSVYAYFHWQFVCMVDYLMFFSPIFIKKTSNQLFWDKMHFFLLAIYYRYRQRSRPVANSCILSEIVIVIIPLLIQGNVRNDVFYAITFFCKGPFMFLLAGEVVHENLGS